MIKKIKNWYITADVMKLHFHINSRNQSKLVMLIGNNDLADGPIEAENNLTLR